MPLLTRLWIERTQVSDICSVYGMHVSVYCAGVSLSILAYHYGSITIKEQVLLVSKRALFLRSSRMTPCE